jgi:hypothetical protein
MTERLTLQTEFEPHLRDKLVAQYFQCDSVNEVMNRNPNCGVSFADLHRELDKRGVVKKRGAKGSSLPYALFFFAQMVVSKLPLERLYREYMPPSFKEKVSTQTLHRISQNLIRVGSEENIRRYGTALVITPEGNDNLVLVGNDVSPPNDKYGKKFGASTIPIGFTSRGKRRMGAVRIFQQEVAALEAIEGLLKPEGELASQIIPYESEPFMQLDITDVRVNVFHIRLPREFTNASSFSSYKLKDYKWMDIGNVSRIDPDDPDFRAGVVDIVSTYESTLEIKTSDFPIMRTSFLNERLALLLSPQE